MPHQSTANMQPLLFSKRILLSVGSGGVGKTTVAATLGLLAARGERKTLVMTIDPAKRLATSLGLTHLGHEQQEIPAEKIAPHGIKADRMYAMMLDPKRTFDDMLRRYAPNEQTITRLFENKLYQQISRRLAGSQEYAAMEMLYEIKKQQTYELLVLDTPPTANALDFLDAPQKMVDAVESPAVNVFVRTYRRAGKVSFNLLGFGAAYVLRRLARFTGGDFLNNVAEFLSDLSGLLGGMHDRAAKVVELLSWPEVGFVIVTSPDSRSIDEAIGFFDRLKAAKADPAAFIINRVHPLDDNNVTATALLERLSALDPPLSADKQQELADVLMANHARMQTMARADVQQLERLKSHCGKDYPYLLIPLFDEDVHDIAGLIHLGRYL